MPHQSTVGKKDDKVNVDEEFEALVRRDFKCLCCLGCVSEPPCDASVIYSRSRNVCAWCSGDLRTLKSARTLHVNKCGQDERRQSRVDAPPPTHDRKFSVEMAAGEIGPSVRRAGGLDI
ncbi:hypothetical protein CLCR_11029 [Cladophialophora carrionii]|uniref:Uncharacterized protein n=1 Tax=Cladophialophora carrionii TaxID=86049 RepID=A0A1C1CYR2_9EURO|nr:hypothetical protein CLCR_11029 [Cladophialophora carrionii]